MSPAVAPETFTVEFTDEGFMRLPAALAATAFPQDRCTTMRLKAGEFVLRPSNQSVGGLILKQRNAAGDKAVLLNEAFGPGWPVGEHVATWDKTKRQLTITVPIATGPDLSYPQPLGVFGFETGILLVDDPELAALMCRGFTPDTAPDTSAVSDTDTESVPAAWPELQRGVELALRGEVREAGIAFARRGDIVSRFNLWSLDTTAGVPNELKAELGPELAVLVDCVQYVNGQLHEPPTAEPTRNDVAALVATLWATHAFAHHQHEQGMTFLRAACEFAQEVPAFAGTLLDELGTRTGDVDVIQQGIAVLEQCGLTDALAQAHFHKGVALHQLAMEGRAPITRAIEAYQATLRRMTAERDGVLFAQTHVNMASIYLTIPMSEASDQLRYGIAMSSLRSACDVLSTTDEQGLWASATLNLANALVYAPSVHRRENLMEAVDLYEQVAQLREKESDQLGLARVRANQGTALGHLGAFADAEVALSFAVEVFAAAGDEDSAATVRETLADLQEHARG